MKQPRNKISDFIAKATLRDGITKRLDNEVAAYLLTENRTAELDSILRDVMQDWANNGIVEVIAVSAFDISPTVKTDIKSEMKKIYPHAKKIIITKKQDPSVIAGVRLELANQQLDLTIQSKLNKFNQLSVLERNN